MTRADSLGDPVGADAPINGFGVYVHYPLCSKRCGYCDFPVVTGEFANISYTEQVLAELRFRAGDFRKRRLATIYFGGGTPSLWPVDQVDRILQAIRNEFDCVDDLEVTLEANPHHAGQLNYDRLRAVGVDRLSLGVQSLNDINLERLSREHDVVSARSAMAAARSAKFRSVSCDLIIGLSGQRGGDVEAEVHAFRQLAPDHLSVYQLTLARGSALFRSGERTVDEDQSADLLETARRTLESSGYLHYEVSNYARLGHWSKHNSLVWSGLPYLGLGASAHSLLTNGRENIRMINPPASRYRSARLTRHGQRTSSSVRALSGSRTTCVEESGARFEMLLGGMRTRSGVLDRLYRLRFGESAEVHFARALDTLRNLGLVRSDRLAPTRRGMWFSDEIALHLMDPESVA